MNMYVLELEFLLRPFDFGPLAVALLAYIIIELSYKLLVFFYCIHGYVILHVYVSFKKQEFL